MVSHHQAHFKMERLEARVLLSGEGLGLLVGVQPLLEESIASEVVQSESSQGQPSISKGEFDLTLGDTSQLPDFFDDLEAPSEAVPASDQTPAALALAAALTDIDFNKATELRLAPGKTTYAFDPAGRDSTTVWKFATPTRAESEILLKVSGQFPRSGNLALSVYDQDQNLLHEADAVSGEANAPETLQFRAEPGRIYFVAVQFTGLDLLASGFELSISLLTPSVQSPINVNPGTGQGSYSTTFLSDLFRGPEDINFHALSLLNVDGSALLIISPQAGGGDVTATIFRRIVQPTLVGSPAPVVPAYEWVASATSNGAVSARIELTAPAGSTLSEGEYVLSVSPKGFSAAPSPYSVEIRGQGSVLGPSRLTNAQTSTATSLRMYPTANDGVAGNSETAARLSADGTKYYRFSAVTGGPTQVEVVAPFDAIISVYDESSNLLTVGTQERAGTTRLSFNAIATRRYEVRVAARGPPSAESFEFALRTPYTASNLNFGAITGSNVTGGGVGSFTAGAVRFFRVNPAADADLVVLRLYGGLAPELAVWLDGQVVRETGPNNGDAQLILNQFSNARSFIVGVYGGGGGLLQSSQLRIPRELLPQSFPGAKMSLSTGDLPTQSYAGGRFGTQNGLVYYQMLAEPNQQSHWKATGLDGALPLLVRYVESGNILKFLNFDLPDAAREADLGGTLSQDQLYAAVVYQLRLDEARAGTIRLEIKNPAPLPIGVGMVPDLAYEDTHSGKWQSILKISNITLEKDFEQDYWQTILPQNFFPGSSQEDPAWPSLELKPASQGSALQLRLSLHDENGETLKNGSGLAIIPFVASEPGKSIRVDFKNLGVLKSQLIGKTIQFRVDVVNGQLDDGVYTLEMTVRTTNPHPYEADETAWKFPGSNTDLLTQDFGDVGILPSGTAIRDIIQNQFGRGTVQGDFDQSGSQLRIHVYRFWAADTGAVRVWTNAVDDSTANTSINLYRARYIATDLSPLWYEQVDYLGGITDVTANQDWYPADRTEIDSQIVITDPKVRAYDEKPTKLDGKDLPENLSLPLKPADRALTRGGAFYYVVVKNEQGSKGKYEVHVQADDFDALVGATVFPNPKPGAGSTAGDFGVTASLGEYPTFTGYLPIQMPDFHNGILDISGQSNTRWRFSLFDAAGEKLSPPQGQGFDPNAEIIRSRFEVPAGSRTVYLRVHELVDTPNVSGVIRAETDLTEVTPLPRQYADLADSAQADRTLLPTDPWGDLAEGAFSDSVGAFNGAFKAYRFLAPAGRTTVNLKLTSPIGANWGLYINGELIAADRAVFANEGSQTINLTLPAADLPTTPEADRFSLTRAHMVVLVVKVAGNTGPARYQIAIDTHQRPLGIASDPRFTSDAQSPLVDHRRFEYVDQAEELHAGLRADNRIVQDRWVRIVIPDNSVRPLVIAGLPSNDALYPIRFDIYEVRRQVLIDTIVATSPGSSSNPSITFSSIRGGEAYLIRAARVDRPSELDLTVAVEQLKDNAPYNVPRGSEGLLQVSQDLVQNPVRSYPNVFGDFSETIDLTGKNGAYRIYSVAKPGPIRITADLTQGNNPRLSLIRYDAIGAEFTTYPVVDYTNDFGAVLTADGKRLVLETYVQPGTYLIELNRTNAGAGQVRIEVEGPEYPVETLVVHPFFGVTLPPNFGIGGSLEYATRFFRATALPGAVDKATFFILDQNADSTAAASTVRVPSIRMVLFQENDGFSNVGGANLAPQFQDLLINKHDSSAATLKSRTIPNPFQSYLVGVHGVPGPSSASFPAYQPDLALGVVFPIPQSGTPDLVAESIALSPNNGQTLVQVSVYNRGYAVAFENHSRFSYPTANPADPVVAELTEQILAPQGRHFHSLDWLNPVSPNDITKYEIDVEDVIVEIDNGNNNASIALKTVDAHRPTLTVSLSPGIDANSDPNVWGRFIAAGNRDGLDVLTDVRFIANDGDEAADTYDSGLDLFEVRSTGPSAGLTKTFTRQPQPVIEDYSISGLNPTTPDSPNIFTAVAVDRFGLRSDEVVRVIQVVPQPSWASGGLSDITYVPERQEYDFVFHERPVEYSKTLSQMLGASIPFIGNWQNEFIIDILGTTRASLNPNDAAPQIHPTIQVELTILNQSIAKETFSSIESDDGYFSADATVQIDPRTLEANAFNVTFALNDLPIDTYEGPEIPIFGFDAGVAAAAVQAQVIVRTSVSAAVSMSFATDNTGKLSFGLISPTFIQLNLNVELRFEGEIEVIGFDIASVGGGIFIELQPKYGLEETNVPIPIETFFSKACLGLTATIGGELSASVLGFEVFSVEIESPPISFTDCNVVTQAAVTPAVVTTVRTLKPGDFLLGVPVSRPAPSLAIDPVTGEQWFAFVQPSAGQAGTSRLFVSRGNDAAFGTPIEFPGDRFIQNPIITLTNDGAPMAAVVTYLSAPAPTADTTVNQFLTGQEIRYRYFNGTSWGEELAVTADTRLDFQHAVAFNRTGDGVLAWVKNANAEPMITGSGPSRGRLAGGGNYVYASRWNPTNHSWSIAQMVRSGSGNDTLPAVAVSASGVPHVSLLEDTNSGDSVLLSTFSGTSWAAVRVPLTGFNNFYHYRTLGLAIDNEGTVHQFLHINSIPQQGVTVPTQTLIVSRSGTKAQLAVAGAWDVIAETGGVSGMQAQSAPDGKLVVSWHERRGGLSDVQVTTRQVGGVDKQPWTRVSSVTTNETEERGSRVAFAPDGSLRVVFEKGARATNPGQTEPPQLNVPKDRLGMIGSNALRLAPELSFTSAIRFPEYSGSNEIPTGPNPVTSIPKGLVGSKVTAQAGIQNSGQQATDVVIEFYRGTPRDGRKLGEQRIRLSPGATYLAQFELTLLENINRVSLKISTADGRAESITTSDNILEGQIEGLADIAVQNVRLTTPNPEAGAELRYEYELANLSSIRFNARAVIESYWIDPQKPRVINILESREVNLDLLPNSTVSDPGTFQPRSFVATFPAGTRIIGVRVTPKDVKELSVGNNRSETVLSFRPDLALIPYLQKGAEVPTPAIQVEILNNSGKDNALIKIAVTNHGAAPVNGMTLKLFYALDQAAARELFTRSIDTVLKPGETNVFEFKAPALAGVNRYRATVALLPADQRSVKELNTADNASEVSIAYQGLADLRIASMSLNVGGNPAVVRIGQALRVTANLVNDGIAAARNFTAEVFISNFSILGNGLGKRIGSIVVDRMDPLSTRTVTITLDTGELELGPSTLKLVIDRSEKILERSDRNNSAELKIDVLPPSFTVSQIDVNTGLTQLSSVRSVGITFSAALRAAPAANALVLTNTETGAIIDSRLAVVTYNATTRQAVWTFPGLPDGLLPRGNYEVRVASSLITSQAGIRLYRDFTQRFAVTPGDINGDGRTNDADYLFAWRETKRAENQRSLEADVNGDGKVNEQDLLLIRQNYGQRPTPPALTLIP